MSVKYVQNSAEEKEKELYYIITGKIPDNYTYLLDKYNISDPNSESVLKYCVWEDYRDKEEYHNFMVKHSDYYQTVTTPYTLEDVKESCLRFLIPKGQTEITDSVKKAYEKHIAKSEKTYSDFKTDKLSTNEKKACALVLSYYTGDKDNSDRTSQNTNAVLRSTNSVKIVDGWNEGEKFYPIIYYLSKALSCLPFYWGFTLRCIDWFQNCCSYFLII